jgi:hypothetical protein
MSTPKLVALPGMVSGPTAGMVYVVVNVVLRKISSS